MPYRADATLELIDSLSGNIDGNSVVQLSKNVAFSRSYNSIKDAIKLFPKLDTSQHKQINNLLVEHIPEITETRKFKLFGLDVTPAPRKQAKTLKDRTIIHQPNTIAGSKPISIGHKYSVLAYLPEKNVSMFEPPWVLPLSVQRVTSDQKDTEAGVKQIKSLFNNASIKNTPNLNVSVTDSAYSTPNFIGNIWQNDNHINVTRLRSNRVVYYAAQNKSQKKGRGHEQWYGDAFRFKDASTWTEPNEKQEINFITKKGKSCTAKIQCWEDMLMRDKDGFPLHKYLFRLIHIEIICSDGNNMFTKPMWLMVTGKRRNELTLSEIYYSYRQRFDMEHFFKTGKTRLLLDKFKTPEVHHEENWWNISSLAYAQMYLAKDVATQEPEPWQKYLPEYKKNICTPSPRDVQKSFNSITAEIGTPANPPKPRGKQLGRQQGAIQPKRERHEVIIKSKIDTG